MDGNTETHREIHTERHRYKKERLTKEIKRKKKKEKEINLSNSHYCCLKEYWKHRNTQRNIHRETQIEKGILTEIQNERNKD